MATGARRRFHRTVRMGAFRMAWLVLACLPASAGAATYGGGNGTPATPFLIQTAEHFRAIGENPADWGKHFRLERDIDLSGYDEKNLRMIGRWAALGSSANQPFWGTFDGNGKTIANFRYIDLREEYVGLFQHVTGEIKNLKLVGAIVLGDQLGTGALVGYLQKGGIMDCSATGVDVSGYVGVGGLVGCADGGVYRASCAGVVSGIRYVGGLVGQVGGTVRLSYSTARVVGDETVGGLVGAMVSRDSIVDSCYATGSVKGNTHVGGLVGHVSGTVFRCFSAGKVTGKQFVGGLVGFQFASAQESGSLWDTQASTQTTSASGTGKTTAQMKMADTFWSMNWDFDTSWTICEGINYPVFLWQIPIADLTCPDGVSFVDFVLFAEHWRDKLCRNANGFCDGADLDRSTFVDFRDLAVFAENWLVGIR